MDGGCFCGHIRYRIDGDPLRVVNCHCTMCRRTSAAPFVTWLVVKKSAFNLTANAPKQLQSSDEGARYFCPNCGTPITCDLTTHPELIDVTLGSLDDPTPFEPDLDVFEDTRLPWLSK